MQKKFAACDWCKKVAFVEPLTYLDGYTNYTCDTCKQTALIDVNRYNQEELIANQNKSVRDSVR
ncbi:hypothetical protein [Vibrio ishigakensis]|uniref:hypothetical protein n=1 Tax=Vibrio ishigakensis TaxID=1481914 RepID=UPI0021C45219|nr:hypothetical protein [Vibrio ishigakensis]